MLGQYRDMDSFRYPKLFSQKIDDSLDPLDREHNRLGTGGGDRRLRHGQENRHADRGDCGPQGKTNTRSQHHV
jgi:hypothetical protein